MSHNTTRCDDLTYDVSCPLAVVIGAGRTGRGLLAMLAACAQWQVVLVDHDAKLIANLAAAGSYPVEVLGRGIEHVTPQAQWVIADARWHAAFVLARLCLVSVGGNALEVVAADLAIALRARWAAGVSAPLDIIVAENRAHSAAVLRGSLSKALGSDSARLADVGIAEAMVLTTSLSPEADQHPLLVRTQNALRLPCDAEALIAGNPGLDGLEPLAGFEHQLQRKLATYNGINAVISYLGAERGHHYLAEAANDPAIAPWAAAAGDEASAALIAEFAFDRQEQQAWRDGALAKFADAQIPDPISRNAGDPARKLRADDRLLYPALLAIRHGQTPTALAHGIAAALRYREHGQTLLERHGSVAAALAATSHLTEPHPLITLVEEDMQSSQVAHG